MKKKCLIFVCSLMFSPSLLARYYTCTMPETGVTTLWVNDHLVRQGLIVDLWAGYPKYVWTQVRDTTFGNADTILAQFTAAPPELQRGNSLLVQFNKPSTNTVSFRTLECDTRIGSCALKTGAVGGGSEFGEFTSPGYNNRIYISPVNSPEFLNVIGFDTLYRQTFHMNFDVADIPEHATHSFTIEGRISEVFVGNTSTLLPLPGGDLWRPVTGVFSAQCSADGIPVTISVNPEIDFGSVSLGQKNASTRPLTLTVTSGSQVPPATVKFLSPNATTEKKIELGGGIVSIFRDSDGLDVKTDEEFALDSRNMSFTLHLDSTDAAAGPATAIMNVEVTVK
ncbi:hypothetical protein [Citrobacter sp. VF227]